MMNFVVIFICMLAGILCKRLRHFPPASAQALNSFVIFLSLPALILVQIPKLLSNLTMAGNWWMPVSMAWVAFLLSFCFFSFLGRKLNWSRPQTGALILTAGLGNTSFVGLPLLESLIGRDALPIGILADQPGSFLALSTLGIIVAASMSGARVTTGLIAKRVATFPPFIALLLAILWFATGSIGYAGAAAMFDKIASTLVPLALFAVGFQLKLDFGALRRRSSNLILGLGFKLGLTPLLFLMTYGILLKQHDLTVHATVLEAAMAPMITSAVVASDFGLDSELANLMVGIGIPVSLLTVCLWDFLWNSLPV